MYIGHIIEDMGAHQRMGAGAGHYFRSMEYQDMAGMDIVLNQIAPGILDHVHTASVNARTVDAEFYHYILAKLPSSLSHTTERMQGRAMCEIFGAFGWAEGIPMMKYLADHMFSCGVNYFVPHAFTPKYPDPDCPPHFYARGKNPQIGAFGDLMTYMRRCAHMISGGTHRAPVAVLYNAEAEWAGGKAMLAERVGRALITAQIDFDVLCGDTLARCRAENGSVSVCGETYRAVVIPESEYLPRAILDDLRRLQAAGVPVIAAGEFLPRACEDGAVLEGCTAVPLSEVASYLRSRGLFDITVEPAQPRLRYYRTTRESRDTVMLFSEDVFAPSRFTLRMQKAAEWRIYDPWTGKLYTPRTNDGAVEIWLAPQGALLLVEDDTPAPAYDYHEEPFAPLSVHASVSVCEAGEAAFRPIAAAFGQDITAMEGMDTFSGTIRYTASVTLTGAETKLSLGEVGEVAAVWLNGKYLGRCVCPPYEIELGDALRAGENELTVEVVNNLGYRHRRGDRFSTYLTMPASGWIGPAGVR